MPPHLPTCARLLPLTVVVTMVGLAVSSAQGPPAPDPADQPVTRHTNRLADQTSPYLRQHAGNPVDWYPWGAEALARARREDKPIFLSIGYSACHWCHVMERECFEDATIAALMNRLFVCIKVDREERPDLDEIYMAAVQAMTGQGGWPMSVWLTPDLEPFFGGTYFPPEDALGRPGFPRVCEQLARAWRERRDDCVQGASEVRQHLAAVLQPAMTPGDMPDTAVATLLDQSASRYDDVEGGFAPPPGFAPKFPHAAELAVLLRMGAAGGRAAAMVARTLDRMAAGGICDQVGGGFHRYSTDRQWLVPHFEKMLYDNAQLVGTYLEAARRAGNRRYGEVAGAVLDYMLRELQSPAGGFFSSQDADSDGEEGKFFVWQRAEFDALLGTDADLAADHFGVTIDGNWEHRNVLVRAREPAELASRHGLELAAVDSRLAAARAKLFAARAARTHPATDDKVLAAWNGLAIEACARGYQALGDRRYLEAARRAAAFVLDQMIVDGRLRRSWHSGRADHPAFLEDHAFVADALLTLFECDGEPRWLEASRSLLQALVRHYRGEDGSFHTTADDHEELIARPSSAIESSTPSGTAGAVRACLRGGLLLGDEALYGAGVAALRANAGLLRESPIACPSLVLALEFHRADPREIVIAGAPDDPRTMALLARARAVFGGDGVIAVVHDGNRAPLEELSPVFAGKVPIAGRPAVYVCRRGACAAPITEPDELRR